MAKARAIAGLSAEDPYRFVAARVIATRTDELIEHSSGVLEVDDIERLHAMRVATRRLRATLEVFEPCFERKPFKRALREVKRVADALGERRDRDVAIASLTELAATFGEAERPGIESLIERLRAEQREANLALQPYLAGDRLAELEARLKALAVAAEGA